ncbi:MAG TPA: hypothetical protein VEF35_04200 [Candidatus Bathyarchaeia archaeon]|nr:hypothetical protein [Candidatus Bathyarchaeia archaeon]
MKVDLNNVEEMLLIPLWGRAQASKAHNSLLNDPKAIEIIDHMDYDFSKLARRRFSDEISGSLYGHNSSTIKYKLMLRSIHAHRS